MSNPGQACMYHSDLGSVMGEKGFLLIDIALHNPSNQRITFPEERVWFTSLTNECTSYISIIELHFRSGGKN